MGDLEKSVSQKNCPVNNYRKKKQKTYRGTNN